MFHACSRLSCAKAEQQFVKAANTNVIAAALESLIGFPPHVEGKWNLQLFACKDEVFDPWTASLVPMRES